MNGIHNIHEALNGEKSGNPYKCLYSHIKYSYTLDSLDRYRDVIGPELVTSPDNKMAIGYHVIPSRSV